MTHPGDVVRAFYAAIEQQDYAAARRLLADTFLFVGWFATMTDADEYVASMQRLRGWITRIEMQRVFADGNDLCLFYNAHTIRGVVAPVAAFFTVVDGRISTVRVVCDSRPFAELWAEQGIERPEDH